MSRKPENEGSEVAKPFSSEPPPVHRTACCCRRSVEAASSSKAPLFYLSTHPVEVTADVGASRARRASRRRKFLSDRALKFEAVTAILRELPSFGARLRVNSSMRKVRPKGPLQPGSFPRKTALPRAPGDPANNISFPIHAWPPSSPDDKSEHSRFGIALDSAPTP